MEQIFDYVLCKYCKEAMHEAYTKGDRLSYVPDRCNTENVSGMRCRDSTNNFQDTDCEEGNDRYPLPTDQVAKLKEENEHMFIMDSCQEISILPYFSNGGPLGFYGCAIHQTIAG